MYGRYDFIRNTFYIPAGISGDRRPNCSAAGMAKDNY